MPATLSVYALVAAGAERASGTGVAGERLRAHRVGTIAAIVGTHPRKLPPTEANLRRYDQLMQRLSERYAAVMPVRFGTYFDDAAALDDTLTARRASLTRAVARLRNRVQMNIRVQGGADAQRPTTAQVPQSGADYLRARAGEQRAHELDPVRDAIARWIKDERVERRGRIASVYHLIPRRSAGPYRDALMRAAAEQGLRVLVSGPWAPYAFGSWS